MRFYRITQKSVQFKTYELFISGILNLTFSDHSWPQVSDIVENETRYKGGLLYLKFQTGTLKGQGKPNLS